MTGDEDYGLREEMVLTVVREGEVEWWMEMGDGRWAPRRDLVDFDGRVH